MEFFLCKWLAQGCRWGSTKQCKEEVFNRPKPQAALLSSLDPLRALGHIWNRDRPSSGVPRLKGRWMMALRSQPLGDPEEQGYGCPHLRGTGIQADS